ncbi:TetR family transcriptional regulator [Sphingomonas sp. I4]
MARMIAERADALPGLAEVFREYGYAGASLSLIGTATGLGRGSLYHFSPAESRRWRPPCSPMSPPGSMRRCSYRWNRRRTRAPGSMR